MKKAIFGGAMSAALTFGPAALADQASSISQYGVTWTFDKKYEVGKFKSGDFWVVAPVKIVSVSPAPTPTRNGSCVNPMAGREGYDDRGDPFDTTDRVSFPYVLTADQSLVSSVSKPEGAAIFNVGCLQSQAVLTAVASQPLASALRPSYAGTYKRYFDSANILWNLLPNLPPPANKPSGQELLDEASRPRIDHLNSWTIQFSCAEDNWNNGPGAHPCYGADYTAFVSDAAQYVMLDTPERNDLAISMIQIGIDNYGVLKAGGQWAPNGGHHSGRKWPIVFAAELLDDCDMLAMGTDYAAAPDGSAYFGEDGQTYDGVDGTPLFGWDCMGGQGSYFENGCTGSGAKDCRDPAKMVDGCPDYRNCCTSSYWVGEMLATLMTQGKTTWNHDPFFDYVDRWMNGGVQDGGGSSSAFIDTMWSKYRKHLPSTPAAPSCNGAGGSGGSSSATGGGAAGGGGPSSGSNGAGGAPGNGDGPAASGCGCRMTAPPDSAAWIVVAGLVLAFARRRA
jgi:MYXO-CTERM domain-containing protein